jgi:predicted glycoside hydrolase/deacetylase ChbG (UPF0249 family)
MRGAVSIGSHRMPANAMLLVNADDFGLHPDIDRGILDCIEQGRVQSVSFSPQGKSLEWKKLAELQRNGVRVGLHVTLVGEPWLTDGRVVNHWKQLVRQLMLPSKKMKRAVEAEIIRQFECCAQNGLDPTTLSHVDSHQHVHVFNGIWQPCQRMARQYAIPRIRVPWAPSWRIIKKNVGGIALQFLSNRRRPSARGYLPCLGLAHAGHNTAEIFGDELRYARGGDMELCVHPGINTPELEQRYADWRFDWTAERDALLSQQFADAVEANRFHFA